MVDEKVASEHAEPATSGDADVRAEQAEPMVESPAEAPAAESPAVESPAAEAPVAEVSEVDATPVEESAGESAEPVDENVNELGFSPDEIVDDEDDEDEEDQGDENASPIEEFVDEAAVAAADEDKEMEWYILKVQVNRENSICDALKRRVKIAGLEDRFGEILVPTEDVREYSKSGKQRIVKRKLYPGYIVVNMVISDESWFMVRETPGIGDFTGAAGKPAPLTKAEIDRIISTTKPEEDDEEENIKIGIKFNVGDQVRVKEGNFQNYEGEVSAIDERNGRITVMISIFGRLNPVEFDHWHVEDL